MAKQRLIATSANLNNVNLLTPAAMLDISCWKGQRLTSVHQIRVVKYENCGVAGCPLFRGCLSIEVNVGIVGTFGIVCYIVAVRC